MTNVTPGGMIAVKHEWPSEPTYWNGQQKGFYNLDTFLTINKAPTGKSYYFWAQQFWFDGGDGGYMGLQTGANLGGKEQKIAIFSIWKALDAKKGDGRDAFAGTFGGEGTGYSCKIAYDWQEGTEYRLRLWEIADARKPTEPEWWGAWVMNMKTKQETFIGQIQVPADWKWMTSSTNFFVEYYLSVSACDQTPYAKATLHAPTRENSTVHPTGAPTLETYGNCKSVAKVTLGSGNAAICETGK
ncbi:MAG: DUF3472 domain-containing protein [Gammaproteobacteria bacterium]|nr:DUF3472 domain-containing protein [Gammaproteobacteria bacterium]